MKKWISKWTITVVAAVAILGGLQPKTAEAAYTHLPEDVIIDNTDTVNVSTYGNWGTSSNAGAYVPPGAPTSNSYLQATGSSPKNMYVDFKPTVAGGKSLPKAGYYDVYISYRSSTGFDSKVPLEIYSSKSYDLSKTVDQTKNGGSWNMVGTYYFSGDGTEYVRIKNAGTTKFVCADAIRFSLNETVTAPPATNLDVNLQALAVDAEGLTPVFHPGITDYSVSIGKRDEVAVTATVSESVYTNLTIAGKPAVSGESILLTGLAPGINDVPVVVSAVYGALQDQRTYVIHVDREKNQDATLKSLAVSLGNLSPDFAPDTVTYTVYAGLADETMSITAVPNFSHYSSLTIQGTEVPSGVAYPVNLGYGWTYIPVIVKAEDETVQQEYVIRVLRQAKEGDLTGPGGQPDGRISTADMGFAAVHYGKTEASADWNHVRTADLNGDGAIDTVDLTLLETLMEIDL